MKWTIQELKKHHRTSNQFAYTLDCTRYLSADFPDLVDISLVSVKGKFSWIDLEEKFLFDLDISCRITMLCAITLDPVDVDLDFHTLLEFAQTITDDHTFLIDGVTINLDPHVFSEILIEMPMKVIGPNAESLEPADIVHLDPDEKADENPFAKLKQK